MELNKRFKQLRKQGNLTQVELAKRSGVGLRFIRDVEQGKKTMRMDKVNQVLKLFGYHLEAIRDERK
ncbi:helix-turn-helix transcriptional regulator [candidate division WOR-3 bacterium]|nr:helix-turn-helix transcriptional regulator [candidate division WOR-3 bacterium]